MHPGGPSTHRPSAQQHTPSYRLCVAAGDTGCADGYLKFPKAHAGTLALWPLTSRMLLLSDQLMYHRVPAAVPTTPMSIVLSNAALTVVPSSMISCPSTTVVPLRSRQNNEPLRKHDHFMSSFYTPGLISRRLRPGRNEKAPQNYIKT